MTTPISPPLTSISTAFPCRTTPSVNQSRPEIAAGGGADRRSAKIASAGMNQSREAHLAERSLHSPEGGQSAAVFAADWPHKGA
jgi:hypothetical protein